MGIFYQITINGKKHTLLFNKHRKPTCVEVLTQAKENPCKLKDRILTNIKENIKDQCENNTCYCWSALDLGDKSSIEERITKLKDLLAILCIEKYTSKKED